MIRTIIAIMTREMSERRIHEDTREGERKARLGGYESGGENKRRE